MRIVCVFSLSRAKEIFMFRKLTLFLRAYSVLLFLCILAGCGRPQVMPKDEHVEILPPVLQPQPSMNWVVGLDPGLRKAI